MNLHQMVRGPIGSINPEVTGRIFLNQGWVELADGRRVPSLAEPIKVAMQVQPLSGNDLRQMDGINVQSIKRGIYLNGRIDGIVRTEEKGGDIIELPPMRLFPGPTQWLVVLVLEYWPDWCKVAVTQQMVPLPLDELVHVRRTTGGAIRVTV